MDSDRPSSAQLRLTLVYAGVLGVLTALYRLVPRYHLLGAEQHFLWNLMPVGALALFVGSRLRSRWAYLVPLGAMIVSDLLLLPALLAAGFPAFYAGTPFVYAGFLLYGLIGRLVRQSEWSPAVIGGALLLGTLQFFLLTNFGSWLTDPTYPRTLAGLGECYLAGLPFVRNTALGDALFTTLFFAGHLVLVRGLAPSSKASQPA